VTPLEEGGCQRQTTFWSAFENFLLSKADKNVGVSPNSKLQRILESSEQFVLFLYHQSFLLLKLHFLALFLLLKDAVFRLL